MLFYRSSSCRANGQSSISRKRTDDTSLEIEMGRMRNAAYWFELRLAQNKGLISGKPSTMQQIVW